MPKVDCQQLKNDLQTLKNIKPEFDSVIKKGKENRNFSEALNLRKKMEALIARIEAMCPMPLREEELKVGDEVYLLGTEGFGIDAECFGDVGEIRKIYYDTHQNCRIFSVDVPIISGNYQVSEKCLAKLKREQGNLKFVNDTPIKKILDIKEIWGHKIGDIYEEKDDSSRQRGRLVGFHVDTPNDIYAILLLLKDKKFYHTSLSDLEHYYRKIG